MAIVSGTEFLGPQKAACFFNELVKVQVMLRSARILLPALFGLLIATTPTQGQENTTRLDLYHVQAGAAEKVSVAAQLKPFKKNLLRTGHKKFTLLKKETVQLKAGESKVITLPGGAGIARLSIDAKGKVKASFFDKKKKPIATLAGAVFPITCANDKLRVGTDKYILVMTKPKKAK